MLIQYYSYGVGEAGIVLKIIILYNFVYITLALMIVFS